MAENLGVEQQIPQVTVRDVVATRTELHIEQEGLDFYFRGNESQVVTPTTFDLADFPKLGAQIDARIEDKSEDLAIERREVKTTTILFRTMAAVALGLGVAGTVADIKHEDNVNVSTLQFAGMGLFVAGGVTAVGRSGLRLNRGRVNRLEKEISALKNVKDYVVPTAHDSNRSEV